MNRQFAFAVGVGLSFATVAWGDSSFSFSTGSPDGKVATGSRPSSAGKIEIESADDFILPHETKINQVKFTGLLNGGDVTDIGQVVVEIYRVFPKDSQDPPSENVPTRLNSPSDVAFDSRDSAANELSFSTSVLNQNLSVLNSVLNGINKKPNQATLGEGPVSGKEVEFTINLSKLFDLPADHYFIIPQVEMNTGEFMWLSAPKPTVPPFVGDLQTWIRNENLAPDWLRVGTDIIDGAVPEAHNASFEISGTAVPLPPALWSGLGGLAVMGIANVRKIGRRRA